MLLLSDPGRAAGADEDSSGAWELCLRGFSGMFGSSSSGL